jgi:hypothetical protein
VRTHDDWRRFQMAEEAKDAAITPKGRHRPEGMGAEVPDGVDYPEGITDGQTTPKNEENPNVEFGGDGKSSQAVPGTV